MGYNGHKENCQLLNVDVLGAGKMGRRKDLMHSHKGKIAKAFDEVATKGVSRKDN